MKFQGLLNGAKNINMIKKPKKFKAPEWFHKLHKDTEEKEKELFEYLLRGQPKRTKFIFKLLSEGFNQAEVSRTVGVTSPSSSAPSL